MDDDQPGDPQIRPQDDVVAFHEAGHAVIARLVGRKFRKVTIDDSVGDDGARGFGCIDYDEEPAPPDGPSHFGWLVNVGYLMATLAGPVAEAIHTRKPVDLAKTYDYHAAIGIVRAYSGLYGLPDDTQLVPDLIRASEEHVRAWLEQCWQQVERVARALLERRTLMWGDVGRAMTGHL